MYVTAENQKIPYKTQRLTWKKVFLFVELIAKPKAPDHCHILYR